MEAKLIVVGGQLEPNEFTLSLPIEIGRGTEADIVIPDTLVSRRHARIFEQDGLLFVQDLDSLNGTFVNDRRISTAEIIRPNELLTLGTLTFRAIYDFPHSLETVIASQPNGHSSGNDTVRFDDAFKDTMVIDQPEPVQIPRSKPMPSLQADLNTDLPTKTLEQVRKENITNPQSIERKPSAQADVLAPSAFDSAKNFQNGLAFESELASKPNLFDNHEVPNQQKLADERQWLEQKIKIPR